MTFVPYSGAPIQRTVKLPLAKHLAGQKLAVEVRPGYLVEREKAPPENLAELIAALADPIYPAASSSA
jgi:hypothetical protein